MHKNSNKHKHVVEWYKTTWPLAIFLGELFEALFLEYYAKYKAAFDAGVWLIEDPGPFLMWAIVWKLNLLLHFNGKDRGPIITFPYGFFEGGIMKIPQLKAWLVHVFSINLTDLLLTFDLQI